MNSGDYTALREREFSPEERLALLEVWVDILYGEGQAKALGLRDRVDQSYHRQGEINCASRRNGGPHFTFMAPVDSLIMDLAEELPPYG